MPIFVIVEVLFALAMLVPSIALAIRRLHDTDESGWMLLIALIPFVGAILLLVFYAIEGTPGPNQFGAGPGAPRRLTVRPTSIAGH